MDPLLAIIIAAWTETRPFTKPLGQTSHRAARTQAMGPLPHKPLYAAIASA